MSTAVFLAVIILAVGLFAAIGEGDAAGCLPIFIIVMVGLFLASAV